MQGLVIHVSKSNFLYFEQSGLIVGSLTRKAYRYRICSQTIFIASFTTEITISLLLTLLDLILYHILQNMPYKVSSMFAPTTLLSQRVGLFTAWAHYSDAPSHFLATFQLYMYLKLPLNISVHLTFHFSTA